MFKKAKASQHFQEVYNCLAKNREAYIPMMSNQDLKEFTSIVASNPAATRFIITAYRANMMILNAMYNFMKTKKNK
jgi:hypothetical protein